ncbi:hypothetical protein B0J13DRAFT_628964 [Dactylonectria estremocensis]|uniref:Uncharacterized protein n=1 Tax=Dactylonectria estremocensis TaxID=1079267 RepID=A0A9P9IH56_9HYPO|nr:hypothetical protein B0J13DRAFT_628964 [Dactylonectria estremocensis]
MSEMSDLCQTAAMVASVLPVHMIPITVMLPEGPLWLMSKGRGVEARVNLRKLRAFDDALIDDKLRVMPLAYDSETAQSAGVAFWELFQQGNIERTLVAGSMSSVKQCS